LVPQAVSKNGMPSLGVSAQLDAQGGGTSSQFGMEALVSCNKLRV